MNDDTDIAPLDPGYDFSPYPGRPAMDWGMDRRRRLSWIISFTDLIALMLSFFVLIYAMAQPEPAKWDVMTESMRAAYGGSPAPLRGHAGPGDQQETIIIRAARPEGMDLGYLESVLQTALAQMPPAYEDNLRLMQAGDRMVISAAPILGFSQGQAAIEPRARDFATRFAPVLKSVPNRIEIIGHAAPDEGAAGPGAAFVLSLQRAQALAAALAAAGYDRPVVVVGAGAGQSATLPQEFAPADRMYFARRADVVILNER